MTDKEIDKLSNKEIYRILYDIYEWDEDEIEYEVSLGYTLKDLLIREIEDIG